jgi:Ca-activated chloride channel family protein
MTSIYNFAEGIRTGYDKALFSNVTVKEYCYFLPISYSHNSNGINQQLSPPRLQTTNLEALKMNILRNFYLTVFLSLVFLLTACEQTPTDTATTPATAPTSSVLKVIAGSELKDIEPMLATIREKTGVQLQMEYTGTLDGAEKILSGQAAYDLAWFSQAKYLSLLQGDKKIIQSQEKIAISPVIPAVKESLAKKWGWTDNTQVTWTQIAEKVKAGELKYAMTDPAASNSGFSTVMSVQAAFSNKADAITAEDVDAEKLKGFFSGQSLTAGSSAFLTDAYLRDEAKLGGMFNYESELLKLNRNPQLKEKLLLIYPKEGTVISDYPILLLNKDKAADYQKVVDYLKSAEFQSWMMTNTDRRPINPAVTLGTQFPKGYLMDLPFPNSLAVVDEILFAYLNDRRKPSHSFFVLDLSGSMRGARIEALKQAMNNLTGDDASITGKFAKFRNRERVTIITFNDYVIETRDFNVDNAGKVSQEIKTYINSKEVGGGTAIFTALKTAYEKAQQALKAEPNRFYSIVLMTDGLNRDGISYDEFTTFYNNNSDYAGGIRTFPILFGEASSDELTDLASLTGGKVFDSRKSSLSQAFKQIRGYQ